MIGGGGGGLVVDDRLRVVALSSIKPLLLERLLFAIELGRVFSLLLLRLVVISADDRLA